LSFTLCFFPSEARGAPTTVIKADIIGAVIRTVTGAGFFARVLRGGSRNDNPNRCRSANRTFSSPFDRSHVNGCRVVLCLHFRACLTGRPRVALFSERGSVVPDVVVVRLIGRCEPSLV
jgi:hypothetical protein